MLKMLTSTRFLWVGAVGLTLIPGLSLSVLDRLAGPKGGDVQLFVTAWVEDEDEADPFAVAIPQAGAKLQDPEPQAVALSNSPMQAQSPRPEKPVLPTREEVVNRMKQMLRQD